MKSFDFKTVNVSVKEISFNDESVIEVINTKKVEEPDENTFARFKGMSFKNGRIDVDVYSQLLDDAPAHARGFIGLAFRINETEDYFESFYIRPTNGRIDDPVRQNRAVQYFAYPKYTFDYFRERGITDYEGPADIGLKEWIHLTIILEDEKAQFLVNHKKVLKVNQLLHPSQSGGIGFFVDIGTRAYYKNLKIQVKD